jgi:hypothetical protein
MSSRIGAGRELSMGFVGAGDIVTDGSGEYKRRAG